MYSLLFATLVCSLTGNSCWISSISRNCKSSSLYRAVVVLLEVIVLVAVSLAVMMMLRVTAK